MKLFFDELITVRVKKSDYKTIMRLVRKYPGRYDTISDFVRIAILKYKFEEQKRGVKQ